MKRIYKVVTYILLSARQPRFMYGMPLVAVVLAILLNMTGSNVGPGKWGLDAFIGGARLALKAGASELSRAISLDVVEAAGSAADPDSTPTGATLTSGPLNFPSGFMTSIATYGAVGDGVTDDTAAIQAALNDARSDPSGNYYGLPKAIYFPPGTYLVSDTLTVTGCCVTFQGAGTSSSIIRLAPGAPGFGGPTPKPVISTEDGNASFHQNFWDLGIRIGPDNAGAVALDWISNNSGSIHDVAITSEDGQGIAGIAMIRHYPGPVMLKNVSITGFQMGIETAAYEYGITIEGITLSGQTVAGIYNQQQTISVRNLRSSSRVPAVVNNGGFALILDATLIGGAGTKSTQGIQSSGNLYLRNVSSTGYGATLQDTSGTTPVTETGTIAEYVQGTPVSLASPLSSASLKLPIQDTPTYSDQVLSHWAAFTPFNYGDTSSLQATLNSGATTVYFPFAAYLSYNEAVVTVPDTVKRIVGFSSVVNTNTAGTNGGGIRFVVNSTSTTPLVVEQFGYGIKIDHQGPRPVVIKDGRYTYLSSPGAGNVFFEDAELAQVTFQAGQSVWARQVDDEFSGTKITNNGTLWILGLKTEQPGIVINTNTGGQTELLGNLIYPVETLPANSIAFQDTNAKVSYIYSESVYCTYCGYAFQVSETQGGVNRQLASSQGVRYLMHLFVGY